jgi:hypothetical protein
MDLTDVYRVLHPKVEEFTLISAIHVTLSKTDHI